MEYPHSIPQQAPPVGINSPNLLNNESTRHLQPAISVVSDSAAIAGTARLHTEVWILTYTHSLFGSLSTLSTYFENSLYQAYIIATGRHCLILGSRKNVEKSRRPYWLSVYQLSNPPEGGHFFSQAQHNINQN